MRVSIDASFSASLLRAGIAHDAVRSAQEHCGRGAGGGLGNARANLVWQFLEFVLRTVSVTLIAMRMFQPLCDSSCRTTLGSTLFERVTPESHRLDPSPRKLHHYTQLLSSGV